jgi:hypothetical protein
VVTLTRQDGSLCCFAVNSVYLFSILWLLGP